MPNYLTSAACLRNANLPDQFRMFYTYRVRARARARARARNARARTHTRTRTHTGHAHTCASIRRTGSCGPRPRRATICHDFPGSGGTQIGPEKWSRKLTGKRVHQLLVDTFSGQFSSPFSGPRIGARGDRQREYDNCPKLRPEIAPSQAAVLLPRKRNRG